MTNEFDVIVVGLGGIGAAITDSLSGQGHRVLGLEQFAAVHDRGSSHGETRIIRKAYFEDPAYVPLLLRSYDLWEDLERDAGESLLVKCGCVMMGPPASSVIAGGLDSAQKYRLAHERLDANSLRSRFGFQVPAETTGFFEPDGGYLFVEKCVAAFHARARKRGADVRFETTVLEIGEGFVTTATETFRAREIVVATGAWTNRFADLPLTPKRAIQFWFNASGAENLPVFFQDTPSGRWLYGFPQIGSTLKVALHDALEIVNPDSVDRTVSRDEIAQISKPAHELIPSLGEVSRAKTCLYTMTPDEHFAIGRVGSKISATGFSGHGFKFAPVIGEIVGDLIANRQRHDIGLFSPKRFKGRS